MKANPSSITRKLKIAKGQIDGILRMIEEDRYCIEIAEQLSSSISLLEKSKKEIMEAHIRNCVKHAFDSQNEVEIKEKLDEVFNCLNKLNN